MYTSKFTGTQVDSLLSTLVSNEVASNTDLNDLTTNGFYTVVSSEVFNTLVNKPSNVVGAGCIIIVFDFNTNSNKTQIMIPNNDSCIYYRCRNNNVWTMWKIWHTELLTTKHIGTSVERPDFPSNQSQFYIGFCYIDTTINKPIFYTGTGWVDSSGTAV